MFNDSVSKTIKFLLITVRLYAREASTAWVYTRDTKVYRRDWLYKWEQGVNFKNSRWPEAIIS